METVAPLGLYLDGGGAPESDGAWNKRPTPWDMGTNWEDT